MSRKRFSIFCWAVILCLAFMAGWLVADVGYKEGDNLAETSIEDTEDPEMILFRHVTSGEWAHEFKPTIFLDIANTDLSRCVIDGRLRLSLNGKIYWIRLEAD